MLKEFIRKLIQLLRKSGIILIADNALALVVKAIKL
jgi:hypothetical protein